MRDIAIRVENPCPEPCPEHSRRDGRRISKRYRIGLREERHDTFAGLLTDFVTRPVRNLRRLRRLSAFGDDGHDRSTGLTTGPEDIIWALRGVSFEACHFG